MKIDKIVKEVEEINAGEEITYLAISIAAFFHAKK